MQLLRVAFTVAIRNVLHIFFALGDRDSVQDAILDASTRGILLSSFFSREGECVFLGVSRSTDLRVSSFN